MTTAAINKKTAILPQCAHCMNDAQHIAISGQTAVGNKKEMVPFHVCEPCYTQMDDHYGSAATKLNLRTLFWEKVNKNVLTFTRK